MAGLAARGLAALSAVSIAGVLLLGSGPALPASAAETACDPESPTLLTQAPPALAQLGIASVRRLSSGAVRVAVVDSGVDAKNPHLAAAVDAGWDFVAGRAGGGTDTDGGGTAVAGQIAARPVRGSSVVGVAGAARIVPVRVYESTENGAVNPTAKRTAEGIAWASDQPGVKVIVVPRVLDTDSADLRRSVARATAHGALVVAAAGDAGQDEASSRVMFPAGYPDALSVTAVDAQGSVPDAVRHGPHIELAVPGAQVATAYFGGDCVLADPTPSTFYAAGYAGGVAALVAAAHPDEEPADWEYRLLATALRPKGADRDQRVGWGLVAPYNAINFVNDATPLGPKNPRFPAPESTVAPAMVPPVAAPEDVEHVEWPLASILFAAAALTVAALLFRRLRTPS